MQSMFLDHNEVNLEINNENIVGKSQIFQKINSTLLNDIWIKNMSQKKLKRYFKLNEKKWNLVKCVGFSKNST